MRLVVNLLTGMLILTGITMVAVNQATDDSNPIMQIAGGVMILASLDIRYKTREGIWPVSK